MANRITAAKDKARMVNRIKAVKARARIAGRVAPVVVRTVIVYIIYYRSPQLPAWCYACTSSDVL